MRNRLLHLIRGLLVLAALGIVAYSCLLLGSAFGPWASIAAVVVVALAWALRDRHAARN